MADEFRDAFRWWWTAAEFIALVGAFGLVDAGLFGRRRPCRRSLVRCD